MKSKLEEQDIKDDHSNSSKGFNIENRGKNSLFERTS